MSCGRRGGHRAVDARTDAHPRHNRLRLTVGLRKDAARWVVTHEHHSFPDKG